MVEPGNEAGGEGRRKRSKGQLHKRGPRSKQVERECKKQLGGVCNSVCAI